MQNDLSQTIISLSLHTVNKHVSAKFQPDQTYSRCEDLRNAF